MTKWSSTYIKIWNKTCFIIYHPICFKQILKHHLKKGSRRVMTEKKLVLILPHSSLASQINYRLTLIRILSLEDKTLKSNKKWQILNWNSKSQEFSWNITMLCFAATVLNLDMVLFSKPLLLIKPQSRIMIMSSGRGSPLVIPRQVHNQQGWKWHKGKTHQFTII